MKDRNVEFPQRYRIQKVEGTDDIYDLIPTPGEIGDEGTLINKASLLKDATAALFGLGTNAVPDDVLKVLSRFHAGMGNEHIWARKCIGAIPDTAQPASVEVGATDLTGYDVKYSSTAGVVDGVVVLTGDIQRINSPSTLEGLSAVLPGKYIQSVRNGTEKAVYYARPDQELFMSGTGVFVRCYAVVSGLVTLGYVNSPNANAYPPAVSDGYTYTYLGQLGNKVQIATGSYTGTGTSYGPIKLTYDITPKLLIILPGKNSSGGMNPSTLFGTYGSDRGVVHFTSSASRVDMVWGQNTVEFTTWNASSAAQLMNESGVKYTYILVG